MTRKTYSFTMPDHVIKRLDSRTDSERGVSRSEVLSQDLSAFYSLLDMSRRKIQQKLTRNEATLILDAMNGCVIESGQAAELWAISRLINQVADGIKYEALDKKWNVDRDEFIDKLYALSPLDRFALADWSKEMWSRGPGEGPVESAKTWEKELSMFLED